MSDTNAPLPKTVDEAIQWMFAALSNEGRQQLKQMPEDDLWQLHRYYGMGIRNELGLWGKNPDLINAPDFAGKQPDEMSQILIVKLWRLLQTMNLDEMPDKDE
ncbi:MAG: hypothetical protein IPO91_31980 [Chloroflexi bacterium]|nr:hypothetical protein [Chloroflexota bacterium]